MSTLALGLQCIWGLKHLDPTQRYGLDVLARDGQAIVRYLSHVAPESQQLIEAIERELAKPSA